MNFHFCSKSGKSVEGGVISLQHFVAWGSSGAFSEETLGFKSTKRWGAVLPSPLEELECLVEMMKKWSEIWDD